MAERGRVRLRRRRVVRGPADAEGFEDRPERSPPPEYHSTKSTVPRDIAQYELAPLLTAPQPSVPAMPSDGISDIPVNLAVPKTDATLTVRVIKSFEFRTEKSLVLHHLNLETTTVGQLKETVRNGNRTRYSTTLAILTPLCCSDTDTTRMETVQERHVW